MRRDNPELESVAGRRRIFVEDVVMLGGTATHRRLRAPAGAGWLHVMGRIDPRRDGAASVSRLAAACCHLPVDLHAYCLMPRHFHLLVRAAVYPAYEAAHAIAEPAGASIRIVGIGFGRHLMEVSRYVHLNPVAAGLVTDAADWPFSSLRAYLGDPGAPAWLVTQAVLGRFGTIGARHRYRAYVEAGLDPRTRDANGRPRWGALFAAGSDLENAAWRIEPMLAPRHRSFLPPVPARNGFFPIPDAGVARTVASRYGVPTAALRSPRMGGARGALARGALVRETRARTGVRLTLLARWLGYRSPHGAATAASRLARSAAVVSEGRGGQTIR